MNEPPATPTTDRLPPMNRWGRITLPAMAVLGWSTVASSPAATVLDRTRVPLPARRAIFGAAVALHAVEAVVAWRRCHDAPTGFRAKAAFRTVLFGGPSLVTLL